ncbi:MAG TPA: DUF418 domain-containing protein [Ferruginibacter sp.]|nr:DUF418 domain-containing protein [Ferruginibacter sp.]
MDTLNTTVISKDSIAAPVAQNERISILDSLRGIAILGILLMNIPSFGLPGVSGDPSVLNETGINYYTWYVVSLIPDGTQRALFSMLFGAGIILFIQSQQKKVTGLQPADYFFRRQLWLMVFSLFDVFLLLWSGDILLDYACLGMMMFTFRNLSAKKLLIAAGICMLLMTARENRDNYLDKKIISKGEAIAALDTTIRPLSAEQQEALITMNNFKQRFTPEKKIERMKTTLRKIGGTSYEQLYEYRTSRYTSQLVTYLYYSLWDVLEFMFLGMAFFKLGILTGQAKSKVYWWMCLIGLSVGILLSYFSIHSFVLSGYNRFEYMRNTVFETYNLNRTFRALGIFGGIMLLYKSGVFKWFFAMMRPAGQMAFTNYLMQSLLCGLYFSGVGFGMMGKLERHEIYYVVGIVWLLQIIYSHIWLHYFRFGPFEWAWRSLTYWRLQPFRKEKSGLDKVSLADKLNATV